MKHFINIAFSFDFNYYRQAVVAISSLLDCAADKQIVYHIYCLIQSDVTDKVQSEIRKNILSKSPHSKISFIDMPDYFSQSYECRGISIAAYFRLMLHRLLPDVDKIIYSDVDVLFKTDLSEINEINMDSYHVGAVRDALYNTVQKRKWVCAQFPYWNTDLKNIGNNYKNSGFLVFNLKKWRESDFDKKIIELSQRNYNFQDQDVLNILFVDKPEQVLILNSKYIVLPSWDYKQSLEENIITPQMYDDILNRPAIIHYAGPKPWDDNSLPQADKWWHYVKNNTSYYSYFKNRLKKIQGKKQRELYQIRIHVGPFDIFSKRKKDNKTIYRILGIKFTQKKPVKK